MPSRKKLEPQINGFPYLGTGAGTDFGKKIFVDSSAAGASDNNPGTDIERPMASVFGSSGAITKTSSALVADRGDLIVCLPGHIETIPDAQTISTSGLRIVGLGVGNNRPTFTYATATAAAVTFGANDIEWSNCIHVCNIASQVAMLILGASADGARILDSEFREGSATGLLFIDISGAADDVKISGCRFFAPTAGNYDAAIDIGAVVTRLEISDCHIYGDFDDAGIHNPTGTVATLVKIARCTITNLQTGDHAIELVSAVTGSIEDCKLAGDTYGSILDPGSCEQFNVLEALTGSAGTPNSSLSGQRNFVSKASGDLTAFGTSLTLFTVTGVVAARCIGVVTTAVTCTSGTSTLEVGVTGATAALLVQDAVDATAFALNDTWTLDTAANAPGALLSAEFAVISNGLDIILTGSVDDMTAGAITFYLEWYPLSAGATVVAA